MPKAEEPRSTPGADVEQLMRLLPQLDKLAGRYRRREGLKPDDMIAGGSRSLLTNLLRDALEWLTPGPVKDAVAEVVQERKDAPPGVLRVSDELDLIQAVVYELEMAVQRHHKHHAPTTSAGGASASQPPAPYHSARWDEGPSGPTLPQHHQEQLACPLQDMASSIARPESAAQFF